MKEESNSLYSRKRTHLAGSDQRPGALPRERAEQQKGLIVKDLHKRLRGRVIIDNLSLQVHPGELVGILGANGSGKSTCFEILAGFLPCDRGSIHLNGRELVGLPASRRASLGLAFLPQDASIFRRMSVADNLRAMLELRGLTPAEIEACCRSLLQLFQLEPLAKQDGASLSGGERRRTELARALTGEPDFLLLDEPFAGMDPISIHGIRRILHLLRKQGIGILVNDHNVREILDLCDRSYLIEQGRILAQGDTQTLLADAAVHKAYLGGDFRI